MKIGIDARTLSGPLTGIGRYTYEMCLGMARLEGSNDFCLFSPSPLLEENRVGLDAFHIRHHNWQSPLGRQFWIESWLPKWAVNEEVDVFWGPAHRLPRLLPKPIARVVTIHDLVYKLAGDTMRPFARLLEAFQVPSAVHNADVIVTDSQATAAAIRTEFGDTGSRVVVIPAGSRKKRNDATNLRTGTAIPDGPFFLFVGTCEPRKNITRLLKAYAGLPKAAKERSALVMAGGKGWGGNLSKIIGQLELGSHVHMMGYVEETVLDVLYTRAMFLAMPSLYEGFGLPIVEAQAYGLPVLAGNNSSMPEVTGDAGILVDATNVCSIQHGLEKMIMDDEFRIDLASRARTNAARFDWDSSARQLMDVMEIAIQIRQGVVS